MMTLSCKDMGMESCDFVAQGETAEEVMGQMMDHAQSAHPEAMEGHSEDEMKSMMTEKMHEDETGAGEEM